jgi:lysophospholipase L1-like esterase
MERPLIHVDAGGIRRSYEPRIAAGVRPVEVYFFGGSTMWGEYARDEHTMPSEVARMAEADGIPVHVVNYGESGWVSWQEALLFIQLAESGVRPDVAVFLDGFNDVLTAGFRASHDEESAVPWGPAQVPSNLLFGGQITPEMSLRTGLDHNSALTRIERGFIPPDPELVPPEEFRSTEETVADAVRTLTMSANVESRTAEAYGVVRAAFIQPAINTRHPMPDGDRPLSEEGPFGGREMARRYDGFLAAFHDPRFVRITDAYEGIAQPIMIDEVHTNEVGYRAVAAAIYRHIAPQLATIARSTARAAVNEAPR